MKFFQQIGSISEKQVFRDKPLTDGYAYDRSLLWLTVLMTAFSLLMIYSASIVVAAAENGSSWYFFNRQIAFLAIGVLAGFAAFAIGMPRWQRHSKKILLFALFLLLLVLVVGRNINGATRWIHVGPANIQPTEIFKLAIIVYMADFLSRKQEVVREFKKIGWVGIPLGLGVLLIMLEPDFGSTVVTCVIALGLLFLVELPVKWFVGLMAFGIVGGLGAVILSPYRMARVTSFTKPFDDPYGSGYQLTHSLMAIGRGEWFGVGIGSSLEKRFYLPEAHTDFIFAIIGEEFGFFGLCMLVVSYGWLVWRAFAIGRQSRELDLFFRAAVAQGIGIWIGIQSFFNIGVNTGVLPTKGLTLPLMSYGGSSAVMMLMCIGLLLRIDYDNRRARNGDKNVKE
ncbi:MAG: putative lipid II flippase FtsW [Neisseria sp.]|nr:putative lipid II flippase FtsW [Neisseria sp.]